MGILKKILRLIFWIAIVLVLVAGIFLFKERANNVLKIKQYAQNKSQEVSTSQQRLPEKQNPKDMDYKWSYAGKNYEIRETLYGSVYDFYAKKPKQFEYQGDLPADWEEKYFAMFLGQAPGDDTIKKISDDIRIVGAKNGLKNDQLADLALSFVQSIPYDEAKAKKILAGQGQDLMNYPYETLYENTGVCSDKSFLAYLIFKELGYGTALFSYDADNHMAVAIRCSQQYSTYDSGYCYAETTSEGNRIGMIPALNTGDNKAQAVKKLNYFEYSQQDQFDIKNLGSVEIFDKLTGQSYAGIAGTIKTFQSISSLGIEIAGSRRALDAKKTAIDADEKALADMKTKMDKYLKKDDYDNYNKLVPKYNDLVGEIKKEINDYNAQIKTYNQKINEYNGLIAGFQV